MTNHMMTGALIAVVVQRPMYALPLAFISHIVIDALPHYGYGFIKPKERDKKSYFVLKHTIDAYFSVFLFWLVPYLMRNQQAPIVTGACMLIAFIPDGIWTAHFVKAQRGAAYPELNWFNRFHKSIQWCERPWGIYVEIIWFVLIAWSLKLLAA